MRGFRPAQGGSQMIGRGGTRPKPRCYDLLRKAESAVHLAHGGNQTQEASERPAVPMRPLRLPLPFRPTQAELCKPLRHREGNGGLEAALAEYRDYKAAGMLAAWRERWKAFLHHQPH